MTGRLPSAARFALLLSLAASPPPARADEADASGWQDFLLLEAFDLEAGALTLQLGSGDVVLEDARVTLAEAQIEAGRAEWSPSLRRLRLADARLRLGLESGVQGEAAAAEADLEERRLVLRDGRVARCPLETTGWSITFAEACLEADGDVVVTDAAFRLFGVPVLWTPWLQLRFGRQPGLRPLQIGSREGRGPFARLPVFLPAGELGDFTLALTGFPLDDLDFAATWTTPGGRTIGGVTGLAGTPQVFLRNDSVERLPAGGAMIGRGTWAEPGIRPAGLVDAVPDEEAGRRFAALRYDRYLLFGGEAWDLSSGLVGWQSVRQGVADVRQLAIPRVRLAWFPGWWNDVVRTPGEIRYSLWRSLEGWLDTGSRTGDSTLSWRQGLEAAVPGIPGVDLRPLILAAGRRDAYEDAARDLMGVAAGARASLAVERSGENGSYHRIGIDLRYLRTLFASEALERRRGVLDGGPDLLRAGLPQILRLGGVVIDADTWIELRSLERWDPAAVTLGASLAAQGPGLALEAHATLDGEARPRSLRIAGSLEFEPAFEVRVQYAYLAGREAVGDLLSWDERFRLLDDVVEPLRHALGGDLAVRLLDGALSFGAGAEADLRAPALAAVRVWLSYADPETCLGFDASVVAWLDQSVPLVSLGLRL